jgi:hypothetical protein
MVPNEGWSKETGTVGVHSGVAREGTVGLESEDTVGVQSGVASEGILKEGVDAKVRQVPKLGRSASSLSKP